MSKQNKLDPTNITFSKKFMPSHHTKFNAVIAYSNFQRKDTTVYLPSFSACYGNRNSYALQRKLIHTFVHEFIHLLIMEILREDKFTGTLDLHWPHEHGLDDDWRRLVNEH